jgi:alanyl-tRNA synthetase
MTQQIKSLEKQLESAKLAVALAKESELVASAHQTASGQCVVAQLADIDGKSLRELAERVRDKCQPAAVVLASVSEGKVTLIAAVSKALHANLKAGELVSSIAQAIGGKGGGRPDVAQAGGSDVDALPVALAAAKDSIISKLI